MQVRQFSNATDTWTLWYEREKEGVPKKYAISKFDQLTGEVVSIEEASSWPACVDAWIEVLETMAPEAREPDDSTVQP